MKVITSFLFRVLTVVFLALAANACVPGPCPPTECNNYESWSETDCECQCNVSQITIEECESSGDYVFDQEICSCRAN